MSSTPTNTDRFFERPTQPGQLSAQVSPPRSIGPATAQPTGSSGARFVGGGPRFVGLVRVRFVCGSSSCTAGIELVTTVHALAWPAAERRGWRVVFDAGEAVRMCPRCSRLAP
jgi:hypothetical protein